MYVKKAAETTYVWKTRARLTLMKLTTPGKISSFFICKVSSNNFLDKKQTERRTICKHFHLNNL